MEFSDGMKFDTSGEYRLAHRKDGWYVVGRNMLLPVSGPNEGTSLIAEMKELDKLKGKNRTEDEK